MVFGAIQTIPLIELHRYIDTDYEQRISGKLYEVIGKEIGKFYGYQTIDQLFHDKKEKEVRIIAFTYEELHLLFSDLNGLFYYSEDLSREVKHLINKRLVGTR